MKVLLMDLDINRRRRPFPNLALMKLSAFHKVRGDQVFLNSPLFCKPDILYASCVFSWNARMRATVAPGTIVGGSGLDLKAELPPEVEHIMPDYSLYPGVDSSMGFTSRGCIRKCKWCIVPEKEGVIRPVARIYEFWDRRHRRIILFDNNLLASPNWRQTMEDLIVEDLEVDFNQGLDIRLVNEENVGYLKRVKARQFRFGKKGRKTLRFAFDDIAYEGAVRRGIELLLDAGIGSRSLSFYALQGFGDDNTAVERVNILRSFNVDIYPMAYKGADGKGPKRKLLYHGTDLWHGPRRNISKFLRLVGRLPE
ncbi:hypothetical protein ES705_50327 [subsurface metagenome]